MLNITEKNGGGGGVEEVWARGGALQRRGCQLIYNISSFLFSHIKYFAEVLFPNNLRTLNI